MRHLITSALPYINGVKHLGNLVGSMLPADVYARYLRARGHEVLAICATDEHGTPAELSALEAGLPVDEYCRQMHEVQRGLGERFALAFDHFGRSSSPQNRELTQHFAAQLLAHGFLIERTTKQVYSLDDERWLADRYVTGTCPHCGSTKARGDQCESCTRVLDPADLIEPRSTLSGSTRLELRDSKHLFIDLPKLADEVRAWVDSHEADWPTLTTSIARKWLDEGLQARGITRDLKWGIPVGQPGYEDKVFYVWFDAPIEYLGATKEWADLAPATRDWRSWWYQADDVRYTQFMAKDNIPFHTIIFPATLLGSREPWKQPDYIKGVNWLTFEGGKFSTSSHRGVFMDSALEIQPADVWRYWLMANTPESSDSDFGWAQFAGQVNKDLVGVYGNFVNRIVKFTLSKLGAEVPAGGEPGEREHKLYADLDARIAELGRHLDDVAFRKALQELRAIWTEANTYLADAAPWSAIKTDRDRAACVVRTALNLARVLAILSAPVMPTSSQKILDDLQVPADARAWPTRPMAEELATLPAGHAFVDGGLLFAKIEDTQVAEWSARFAGQPTE
ncbi:MAG: methionine--tRNA ligase [Myxococcales bacterium]|nr:methionine--tRNA ligase [Myxococcales bacterium]